MSDDTRKPKSASFDLAEQPFIPCLDRRGQLSEYSLKEVLCRAHELSEIRDQSPLVTIAIYRLLLAILHHAIKGPQENRDRLKLRRAKMFDRQIINAYFHNRVGKFDLFHPKHPFYQTAGITTNKAHPITRLAQELPRKDTDRFFDHVQLDPPLHAPPSLAARWLLADQAYAIGGGNSSYITPGGKEVRDRLCSAPLVSGATILAMGDTLFETLWLNLTVFNASEKPMPCLKDDAPVWDRPPMLPSEDRARPRGYLDYLTWQSRTLLLIPQVIEGRLVVPRVYYAAGRRMDLSGLFDPMQAYSRHKELGYYPLGIRENRDLWRDSGALFQISDTEDNASKAPATLHEIANFMEAYSDELPLRAKYRVMVFGLCNDQAKVNYWRHETLPLPLVLLKEQDLVGTLRTLLELTEKVAVEVLRPAVRLAIARRLSNQTGKTDKERVSALVAAFAPERRYWSHLETPFREWLDRLAAADADANELLNDWYRKTLRKRAIQAYEETLGQMDQARDLEAVQVGRGKLFYELRKLAESFHLEDSYESAGAE